MKPEVQQRLRTIFGTTDKEIHIILFDCQGTEVEDEAEDVKVLTVARALATPGALLLSENKQVNPKTIKNFLKSSERLTSNQQGKINTSIIIKGLFDNTNLKTDEESQGSKWEESFGHFENRNEIKSLREVTDLLIFYLDAIDRKEIKAFSEFQLPNIDDIPHTKDVSDLFWCVVEKYKD